jgi:hypothetical protein
MEITIGRRQARIASPMAKVVTTILLVAVLGTLAISQAAAAFRPTPETSRFHPTGVRLSTDAAGHAMFDASSLAPGETATSTIHLTYAGNAPAEIRLYGTTSGLRFARALRLEITRDGYTVYRGSLADFPDTFEGGVVDPSIWLSSNEATYRFEVTLLPGTMDPPAGNTSQTFSWQARSV